MQRINKREKLKRDGRACCIPHKPTGLSWSLASSNTCKAEGEWVDNIWSRLAGNLDALDRQIAAAC